MIKKIQQLLPLLIGLCLLIPSGCGWHLQGMENLPPQLNAIYIKTAKPYSDFTKDLKKYFHYANVNVVNSVTFAQLIINITNESVTTTETSVASTQQIRNYTATYSVTFSFTNKYGKVIEGPITVTDNQVITILPNEVLTNSNKLAEAEKTMRRNIINKIIWRLSAKDTIAALQHSGKT